MIVECNKSNLLEGLLITERGTTSKSTIPHLEGFLININISSQKLIINTYDLEMGIEYRLNINIEMEQIEDDEKEVKQDVAIVLPYKILDIIRKLPEENIKLIINSENYSVDLKSGKAHFEIKGLDPNEYPNLPDVSSEKTFSIPQNILKQMITQTSFAVSKDETKPAFTGILLRFKEEKLDMIATDSFRLAWKEGRIINDNQIDGEYIVPFKALTQISRIIHEEDSLIKLLISDHYIICETENIRLFSKLIDENFPNLEQVIPKNYLTLASIDKKELLSTMERASLLASDGANNIIKFNIEEDKLLVTSNSPQTGKLEEELDIKKEGDNLNIALNAKFMIDVLKVLNEESVNLEFSGAYSPLMVKTKEELPYLHLILPVRAL